MNNIFLSLHLASLLCMPLVGCDNSEMACENRVKKTNAMEDGEYLLCTGGRDHFLSDLLWNKYEVLLIDSEKTTIETRYIWRKEGDNVAENSCQMEFLEYSEAVFLLDKEGLSAIDKSKRIITYLYLVTEADNIISLSPVKKRNGWRKQIEHSDLLETAHRKNCIVWHENKLFIDATHELLKKIYTDRGPELFDLYEEINLIELSETLVKEMRDQSAENILTSLVERCGKSEKEEYVIASKTTYEAIKIAESIAEACQDGNAAFVFNEIINNNYVKRTVEVGRRAELIQCDKLIKAFRDERSLPSQIASGEVRISADWYEINKKTLAIRLDIRVLPLNTNFGITIYLGKDRSVMASECLLSKINLFESKGEGRVSDEHKDLLVNIVSSYVESVMGDSLR